ncbi:rhomboid family intramembrane serine protease [Rhodohalobacter sp. SW132]|uniref:rhomboid family intramembrane serine protease n=1 Tax=Rhodohalobacter sp. SW132 TaxID=2293433 RepID=UPI000E26D57B|nr:rhomboid family intramembrane serine protease [Rhodohalobacter sp. SW132]REL38252.1 rhomboid family intramembrane serine protease [Rhodohalobacter sp. SW132]
MSVYQQDSFWNAFKRGFLSMPPVIRTIIAINVVIFVLMALLGSWISEPLLSLFAFNPDPFTALTQPWRIITYMFLHGGGFHLIFNMLWLWWMGRMVEESIGPRTFSVIFFGAGIGGALLQVAYASVFGANFVIGASGAVLGIMVAFAYLFPTAPIMLLFLPPIQARFFVAGWIALDFLLLGSGDNVARLVHLGGAGTGFLLTKMHYQGYDLSSLVRPIEQIFKGKGGSKKKKKKPKRSDMYAVSDVEIMEEQDVDELDEILEKISKKGYDGLTAEEKKKLFDLSKKN